jgi:hypothetical protein
MLRKLYPFNPMCDPVLIAAILEELGCFDEKKKKDKNDEVHGKETDKDNSENIDEEEK